MPPEVEGLERQLASIVGHQHLLSAEAAAGRTVDGLAPRLVVRPETQAQVEAVVAACGKAGAAVLPWGGGTAMTLGNSPQRLDVVIGLDRLARIVEFDVANLNVTAEAGVRLADLQQVLAERRESSPWIPLRPSGAPWAD